MHDESRSRIPDGVDTNADNLDWRSTSSTIGEEKRTNIFLRAGEKSVKSALGMDNSDPFDVFVELRQRKDVFK